MRMATLLGRMFPYVIAAAAVCILAIWIPFWVSCSAGSGACVGSGGVLLSPVCKEGWGTTECADWDAQQINGASWEFYSGKSCGDLGYPYECSDGSYRQSSSSC